MEKFETSNFYDLYKYVYSCSSKYYCTKYIVVEHTSSMLYIGKYWKEIKGWLKE